MANKYSAYFLGKKDKVEEQYFEASSVEDAISQAQDYAKDTNQRFSSLWQLQKLTAAGKPIVNKEAKGRLDTRGPGEASYGEGGYKDKDRGGYKDKSGYKGSRH